MFGKEPQELAKIQQQQEEQGKSFLQKMEEMKQAILGHTEAIKQLGLDRLLPSEKAENIVFNQAGYTVDKQGYPYMGIFVSAAQTFNVDYLGTTYQLALSAGFNVLILPNEARLVPTNNGSFTGILIRSTTTFQ